MKLLTVGLIQDQCHLHNITIHLKIKKYLKQISQLNLFQKQLTKQEDGSIHYLQFQHAIFDTNPFENCIVLGHVLDKNGLKMSKHKGNVVESI